MMDPLAIATDGYIIPETPPVVSVGGALGGCPEPPRVEPIQPVILSSEKEGC